MTCDDKNYLVPQSNSTQKDTVNYKPETQMSPLETRTRVFWEYLHAFSLEPERLALFADRLVSEEGGDNHSATSEEVLSRAFLGFASTVGINVKDRTQLSTLEFTTLMHEQIVWEHAFRDLVCQLGIKVSYVSIWPDDMEPSSDLRVESEAKTVESEARTCFKNHHDEGFKDQRVYIWDGHYKGKLGRVIQMNGNYCRVGLEDAVVTVNAIVIEGRLLIAYVPYLSHQESI